MAEDSQQISVALFKLFLNGSEIEKSISSAIESVEVEDEINLPAMFTIKIGTMNIMEGKWRFIDLESFKLGDEIKISMGMNETEEVMTGEITSLEPTFSDHSYIILRGYDRLHNLRFGTFRRSFKEMKVSDIASSMASEAGLSPEVEDTSTKHPYLFQNNQSNYEFLLACAKKLDYEMLADDKTLIFRKSKEDTAQEVTLGYTDLGNFTVRLGTLTQGSEVEVRGWDMKKKEEIVVSVGAGSENSKMDGDESGFEMSEGAFGASPIAIVDNNVSDESEAEEIGKARYNAMLKQFMVGDGECGGNPKIRAGKTIKIEGVGEKFSGKYYVKSSVHSLGVNDSYKTKFNVVKTGV